MEGLVQCGSLANPCDLCDLFQLAINIVNFFLFPGKVNNGFAVVPLLASFLFVWGGFIMITSSANPQASSGGKTILTATVVGLIIVYASWILVNTIFQALGVAQWAGLGNWWQIQCGI